MGSAYYWFVKTRRKKDRFANIASMPPTNKSGFRAMAPVTGIAPSVRTPSQIRITKILDRLQCSLWLAVDSTAFS